MFHIEFKLAVTQKLCSVLPSDTVGDECFLFYEN